MPLRLIGVDRPVVNAQFQAGSLAQTNDQSGEALEQGSQLLQKAAGTLAGANADIAKNSQQMTENTIQGSQRVADNALKIAEVAGRRQADFSKNLSQISEGLTQFQNVNFRRQQAQLEANQAQAQAIAKTEEANRKTAGDYEYTQASTEMEQLKLNAYDLINKEGEPAYVRRVLETAQKYKTLTPEQIRTLTSSGYADAQRVQKDQVEKKVAYTKQVQERLVEQAKQEGMMTISALVTSLDTPMPADKRQAKLNELRGAMDTFVTGVDGIDDLGRISVITALLETTNKYTAAGMNASQDRAQVITDLKNYSDAILPLSLKVQRGEMTIEDYYYERAKLKAANSITGATQFDDPNAALRWRADQMGLNSTINQYGDAERNRAMAQMEVDPFGLAQMVYAVVYDATPIETFTLDPAYKGTAWAGALENVVGDVEKLEKLRREGPVRTAKLKQALAAVNKQEYDKSYSLLKEAYGGTNQVFDVFSQMMGVTPQAKQQIPAAERDAVIKGWFQNSAAMKQALVDEYSGIQKEQGALEATLSKYGLQNGKSSYNVWQKENRPQIEAALKRRSDVLFGASKGPEALPDPIRGGNGSTAALKRITVNNDKGKSLNIPIPFKSSVGSLKMTSPYGMRVHPVHGGHKHHDGIDIAGGTGNDMVVAMTPGKVTFAGRMGGYGNRVEVRHADGTVTTYSHLSKIHLKRGQMVYAGSGIGNMGTTGTSTGNHLHFEVRTGTDENGKNGQSINPLIYLEQLAAGKVGSTPMPRNNTTVGPHYGPVKLPAGSIPLGDGTYYYKGKRHKVLNATFTNGGVASPGNTTRTHNKANPVRSGKWSTNKADYDWPNDEKANYGYGALSRHGPKATQKLAWVANKLGIPAVWLADMLHNESGFNPDADNGIGYQGLIQFNADNRRRYGVTTGQSFESQMNAVYKYLHGRAMEMGGLHTLQRGPESVMLAIWAGPGLHRKWLNGENIDGAGDGWIKFGAYKKKMGASVGRQYNYGGSSSRRARLTTGLSAKANPNTREGAALIAAGAPDVPHYHSSTEALA